MPYCSKCGAEVQEEMAFCPKCGYALVSPTRYRAEKAEKHEKEEKMEKAEKGEKTEKYEKRGFGVVGQLIGGFIMILLGLVFYLERIGYARRELLWASFFVVIGVMIIIGSIIAARRNPKPL